MPETVPNPHRDIFVLGGSAGAVEALRQIVAELPADLPATLFVVTHISAQARSLLPEILSHRGKLPAQHARDGERVQRGRIYIAPPDHHLSLHDGMVRLLRGPKENLHRPAVDPLFRSAARWFGPRVVGVVLSGSLDDGTAGLMLIKKRGGVAVVQQPDDAVYRGMPCSALAAVEVDHSLPASQIGPLLVSLAHSPAEQTNGAAAHKNTEVERGFELTDQHNMNVEEYERQLGPPSVVTCPTCHGATWELEEGGLVRFQCHVGHAFSAESMLAEQNEDVERAMWIALRSLDDNIGLLRRLAEKSRTHLQNGAARRYLEAADEKQHAADLLRDVLMH